MILVMFSNQLSIFTDSNLKDYSPQLHTKDTRFILKKALQHARSFGIMLGGGKLTYNIFVVI